MFDEETEHPIEGLNDLKSFMDGLIVSSVFWLVVISVIEALHYLLSKC
jgi:hypothetical protein